MLRIAICDDDIEQTSLTETLIVDYFSRLNTKVEIDVYTKGETIIKVVNEQEAEYQLIFLDIKMQPMNGLVVAQQLRKKHKDFLLIFLTSYEQYSLKSFLVNPFRYLLKPLDKEVMKEALDRACEELEAKKCFLFYHVGSQRYQMRVSDVASIESQLGRKVKVLTMEGETVEFYGKIKDLYSKLPTKSSPNFCVKYTVHHCEPIA